MTTIGELPPDVQAVSTNGRPPAQSSAAAAADGNAPVSELLAIAREALAISPPLPFIGIFGPPRDWFPPYRRFSEYSLLNPWRPLRMLKFLQNTWIPSIPRTPPLFSPPFLNDFFWQPTKILQRPDQYESYTSFPREAWFLINGIMTNDAVAQLNAALLSELFHRPIALLQNSTSSLFTDLLECALDKMSWRTTEPVVKIFPIIYDALTSPDKERVVLIAHSQGTIIAAVLLRLLLNLVARAPQVEAPAAVFAPAPPEWIPLPGAPLNLADFRPLQERELAKLELYCFATCANTVTHLRPPGGDKRGIPHIEHFGNEFDIVARLGMQAPNAAAHGIHIEGPRYVRLGAWGHWLNAHYLYPIADAQRQGRRRGGRGTPAPFVPLGDGQGAGAKSTNGPRLFAYINGGSPPD